jgi:hypothetical protein
MEEDRKLDPAPWPTVKAQSYYDKDRPELSRAVCSLDKQWAQDKACRLRQGEPGPETLPPPSTDAAGPYTPWDRERLYTGRRPQSRHTKPGSHAAPVSPTRPAPPQDLAAVREALDREWAADSWNFENQSLDQFTAQEEAATFMNKEPPRVRGAKKASLKTTTKSDPKKKTKSDPKKKAKSDPKKKRNPKKKSADASGGGVRVRPVTSMRKKPKRKKNPMGKTVKDKAKKLRRTRRRRNQIRNK